MISNNQIIRSKWIHKILSKVAEVILQPSDESSDTKPKAKPRTKDCTKLTLNQVNTVIDTLAKVNSCKHKQGYTGPKSYKEATKHLNELFGVNKSRSVYARIWLAHLRKLEAGGTNDSKEQ